jgi:hypothetical protein
MRFAMRHEDLGFIERAGLTAADAERLAQRAAIVRLTLD